MVIPPHVMEGLFVAVGATGAFTFVWLARAVAGFFARPLTVAAHASPGGGCLDVLLREIGAARRDLVVQAAGLDHPAVVNAVLDARKRGARVEVVLEADAALAGMLRDGGVFPKSCEGRLFGQVFLIDNKTVLLGDFPLGEEGPEPIGRLVVVKNHPTLAADCRRAIDAEDVPTPASVARAIGAPPTVGLPMAAPIIEAKPFTGYHTPLEDRTKVPLPPEPVEAEAFAGYHTSPEDGPKTEVAPAPVAEAVPVVYSRPSLLPQRPTWSGVDEEEAGLNPFLPVAAATHVEEDEDDDEPLVPLSSADLFARLRRQAAEQAVSAIAENDGRPTGS